MTALSTDPLINGENTKDVTVGCIVFINNEDKPNTRPIRHPCLVPNTIAAIITGT